MITNIFWADHEMITDYELFGDAVSFDTTFRTNKEYRPLALFTGFNHFRKTVIFDAKSGEIKGGKVEVDENDPKLEISARYRDLCPRMVKLATQASVYKPAYQLVDEGIKELCTKVNKMMVSFDDLGDCGSGSNIDMTSNPNFARVKGLKKKKSGQKGGGRLKPWHEKTNKRKKIISQPTDLSKKIGQSSNTLIVQSSSLCRSQNVGIPYWPQLMNYGHNVFKLDDTNIACSSSYP
ncbi:hypothetical protein ACSBR2_016372 [Camellia fascicularis]